MIMLKDLLKQTALTIGIILIASFVSAQDMTQKFIDELKNKLSAEGYKLEQKDKLLIANKSDERKYFSLDLKESYADKDEFMKAAYIGATYVKDGFKQPFFPVGPYIYGGPQFMQEKAEKRGISLEELFEAHAKDIAAHGGNTIYYANLSGNPEVFKMAVKASLKHGVYVFGQLTGDLYLRAAKGKEYYEKITKPAIQKILPQYRDVEGILGWMGCEEAKADEMPLVIEYRKLCKELDPTHGLYTLHNHLEPFKADMEPYPEWYGFDRYRFRCVESSGVRVISTPSDMAYLLSKEISASYDEAAKRGRPLIYVGQSYGHLNEIKTEKMEKKSGFREVSSGVWHGWLRYPPPENGMYLQSWLAVCEGAKGLLWYYYYGEQAPRKDQLKDMAFVGATGSETRLWKEHAECMSGMKTLFPLFISWHKEGIKRGSADNNWIKHNSFIREFDKERYYVFLNTRIAEWDKGSPRRPNNKTELYFDENGLAGFKKAGPLTFKFQPDGNEPLWDILTGKKLETKDNQYEITLGPGRGLVLMQGNENDIKNIRKFLNLN